MIIGNSSDAVTDSLRQEFEQKAFQAIKDGAKVFGEMAALHFSFSQRHGFSQTPADHPLFLLLADITHQPTAKEPEGQNWSGECCADLSIIRNHQAGISK
jgi:hypothetical protein